MAVSALQQALTRYRADLLNFDQQALNAALSAYAPVKTALLKQIDELVALQAKNSTLTGPQFWRLNRASELLQQVQAEMATLQGPITQIVGQGQAIAVQAAATQAKALAILSADSAALAGKIGASWIRLPTSAVVDLVGRLSDGGPLKAWVDQFGQATSQRLQETITNGLALGLHPTAIAADLAQTTDVAATRLLSFTRQNILGAYRSSTLRTFSEQGDIADTWTWLAALDQGTCAACLSLNGQTFPITQDQAENHVGCRCTMILNIRGIAPMVDPNSGAAFFDGLTPAQQDRTLGAKAGAHYRAGNVSLSDFVVRDDDPKWGAAYRQGSLANALAGKDAG